MAESTRIESVDNPKVKDVVRLRDRRSRRKTGRFLVEGAREISRALEAGHPPLTVFVEPKLVGASGEGAAALELCRRTDVRIFDLSPRAWAKVALREDRDGIVAIFPIPKVALEDLALGSAPLVLAVIDLEKPGNLGAILRSADAFGVSALLAEGGTDIWNPNVVRASLGSLFTVPLATAPAGELLPWLRSAGLRLVAATPDGDTRPSEVRFDGPVAIVIGSEERGLDPAVLDAADVRVRIPMRGTVDSLNVSVSAGILLYEAVRQRSSRWTPRASRLTAGVILAVALALRVVHVLTIREYPLFDVLPLDSESYDTWARRIASGELLRGRPFYQAPPLRLFPRRSASSLRGGSPVPAPSQRVPGRGERRPRHASRSTRVRDRGGVARRSGSSPFTPRFSSKRGR